MAKLDKTQRDYILRRLGTEASKAVEEFRKNKPEAFSTQEIKEKLESKGFIVQDRTYFYVTLPPTAAMVRNKEAIETFTAKVQAARQKAEDQVYLSDADGAAEILEQFAASLNKL